MHALLCTGAGDRVARHNAGSMGRGLQSPRPGEGAGELVDDTSILERSNASSVSEEPP